MYWWCMQLINYWFRSYSKHKRVKPQSNNQPTTKVVYGGIWVGMRRGLLKICQTVFNFNCLWCTYFKNIWDILREQQYQSWFGFSPKRPNLAVRCIPRAIGSESMAVAWVKWSYKCPPWEIFLTSHTNDKSIDMAGLPCDTPRNEQKTIYCWIFWGVSLQRARRLPLWSCQNHWTKIIRDSLLGCSHLSWQLTMSFQSLS